MKSHNTLHPSQLLEILVTDNNWDDTPEIVMTINKFHDLVRQLNSDIVVDFDFLDLIDTSKRFSNGSITIIEEVEIHLHRDIRDRLASHLNWYNSLYSEILESNRISDIWKTIVK